MIGKIVREIRRFKPDVIFCQDPYNRARHNHRDHRMAGQSTFDAVYPFARDRLHFPEHIAEGFEPHKVAEIYTTAAEDPDVVIDTSDVIDIRDKGSPGASQPDIRSQGNGGANPGAGLRSGRARGVQVRRRVPPVHLQPRKATARICPLTRSLAPNPLRTLSKCV